jgi:hypothetical protein
LRLDLNKLFRTKTSANDTLLGLDVKHSQDKNNNSSINIRYLGQFIINMKTGAGFKVNVE